ncbi:MAG TPA: hydroxyethylthiazole kinase [Microvirga sp.]
MTSPLPFDAPALAGQLIARLAAEPVRVHAITNAAAQVLTANLLLAAGGIPSLTTAPDEVPAFTARAGALLVNLGTLDGDRRASIPWAIATARAQHRPWVLDPVFVDASPSRLELARLCLAGGPAVLRCNEAEFTALAEAPPEPDALKAYAREHAMVLALTGPVDRITDGERLIRIGNGHPLMARVTAMGCAATALVAAFTALHSDAFEATVAALLATGIAGEIAAEAAAGPGSFAPAFLDALAALEAPMIVKRARLP